MIGVVQCDMHNHAHLQQCPGKFIYFFPVLRHLDHDFIDDIFLYIFQQVILTAYYRNPLNNGIIQLFIHNGQTGQIKSIVHTAGKLLHHFGCIFLRTDNQKIRLILSFPYNAANIHFPQKTSYQHKDDRKTKGSQKYLSGKPECLLRDIQISHNNAPHHDVVYQYRFYLTHKTSL